MTNNYCTQSANFAYHTKQNTDVNMNLDVKIFTTKFRISTKEVIIASFSVGLLTDNVFAYLLIMYWLTY